MIELLTTEEVAAIARTTPATVRYWHHAGKGPTSRKVGRRRLYSVDDVTAWLDEAKAAG